MKLIDRIRPIADTQEYSEFAERWRRFVDAGHTGYPGHVVLLLEEGTGLRHKVMQRAAEHAKAQVRSRLSLTETQADQVITEAKHGADRAMRKLMPELAAFVDFISVVNAEENSPRQTAEAM